jgi:uroporphyrinogen decarboxylase
MACYGMVGDVACWLAGIEPLTMLAADDPSFVHQFIGIIEEWNTRQMAAMLGQGVDLIVRRAWYENADVWSPARYREFLLPGLRRDVAQAHAAGAKFGYLVSCASLPLVDMMLEAGVDVLLGVDPAQDRSMDLAVLKRKAAGRMCLWGGVCGYLTVECGTPVEIRQQVREAVSALAPGGGFILSPVTNVREDTPRVWANLEALIATWREVRGRGTG